MVWRRNPSPICSRSCGPRRSRALYPAPRVRESCRLLNGVRGRFGVVRRKPKPIDDRVTGADIIAFIESVCLVPEGKLIGQPLVLQDWQKDLIRLVYDNPYHTRRAIFSMARKN